MDIKESMKLIQGVSDYGLTSFELEEGNMRISLKREKETIQVQTPVLAAAVPAGTVLGAEGVLPGGNVAAAVLPQAPLPAAAGAGVDPLSVQKDQETEDIGSDQVVTSPLVGVFYAASSPDAEPFVKVGDQVKKGQILGIIEAMKLMNEIESEYDGIVEAILVKNEDVVEFGQPLFRIR